MKYMYVQFWTVFIFCMFWQSAWLSFIRQGLYTPTKRSNAQHLAEYEKQLLYEENKKIWECYATAYGFLRLWYNYEFKKYSN